MTDRPSDHDDAPKDDEGSDDAVVSAYLDGEASPAERARVEGDPVLLARLDQFGAVTRLINAPVEPPDGARRHAILAKALAAAADHRDSAVGEDQLGVGAPVAPAVSLAQRRRRRTPRASPAPGLVAAAVTVMFLIGVGLVVTAGGDGRSNDASTAARDQGSADGAGASAGETEAGGGATAERRAQQDRAETVDLGAFADRAALRQVLIAPTQTSVGDAESGAPDPDPSTTGSSPPTDDTTSTTPADQLATAPGALDSAARCAAVVASIDAGLGELITVRTASIDGQAVWVFTHAESIDTARLTETVTDRESCEVLFAVAHDEP